MSWFEALTTSDEIVGALIAVVVGAGSALVAALAAIRRTGRVGGGALRRPFGR